MIRLLAACLALSLTTACSTVLEERSIGRSFDDTNASWTITLICVIFCVLVLGGGAQCGQ